MITTDSFPIYVYIPQLDGFHWSDFSSLFIAIIAICSLAVAVSQVKDAKRSNANSYSLAKSQLDQMKVDSQRQYEQAILQIKRENRIRIYAPLLAYLRASMMEFESKSASFVLATRSGTKSDHDLNYENLRKNVSTYEFSAELELLGDPKVSPSVNKWMRDLDGAYDQLEDLRDLQKGSISEDQNRSKEHMEEIKEMHRKLSETKRILRRDLNVLKEMILGEFQ